MALVTDLVDLQELQEFVRDEIEFPEFTLDRYLPVREVMDIEYEVTRDNRQDQDVAPYRAFDAEAAIGARQGLERVRGKIPPLSKKIPLGEEQRLRLQLAEGGQGARQRIIDQVFDDAANLVRSLRARLELARGEALYDGKVDIEENGVRATADFEIPANQRVSAATAWSDPTASIVTDIRAWMDLWAGNNSGRRPRRALTSSRIFGYMLLNDEIRSLAASVTGAPRIVSEDMQQAVFRAYGLPPVEVYDVQVQVDGVATNVIPDDRFLLLPGPETPLGATTMGVTAEALDLQANGYIDLEQLPGLVAVVAKTEFDPVATWTKAAAIGIPNLNGNRVLTADVA